MFIDKAASLLNSIDSYRLVMYTDSVLVRAQARVSAKESPMQEKQAHQSGPF